MNDMILWQPEKTEIVPKDASTAIAITEHAAQLTIRDKKQIVSAFSDGHYEMAISYLWGKTITALKKELSAVGIGLLGEMLGKVDLDEDDDVEDILTTKDTIRLAEELGVVSSTDALRLRHTHELLSHFSKLDDSGSDEDILDEHEAISSLKACVKGVLGRPKVEVAKKFIEFREALEGETLSESDYRVDMLKSSPYFFHKLTVSVLMNAAKKNAGANLEHALANINAIIPSIWALLRETERWQIGYTYAELFADGKSTALGGVKNALLKVKGFDYVPENLRSDTFIKAAEAIFKAHDGLNNFYNEYAPVKNLAKLGSTIPTPAIPACISALLCVVLGNQYGVAWNAKSEANEILKNLSTPRWEYYLNHVLPSDMVIINKIGLAKPAACWVELVASYNLKVLEIKNVGVKKLLELSNKATTDKLHAQALKIKESYYGRK